MNPKIEAALYNIEMEVALLEIETMLRSCCPTYVAALRDNIKKRHSEFVPALPPISEAFEYYKEDLLDKIYGELWKFDTDLLERLYSRIYLFPKKLEKFCGLNRPRLHKNNYQECGHEQG